MTECSEPSWPVSYKEMTDALRRIFGEDVLVRGTPEAVAPAVLRIVRLAMHNRAEHKVGEYTADYTMPTPTEIHAPDTELDELEKNSRAVAERMHDNEQRMPEK